jgi:alanyl-tRNA synthetase
VKRLESEQGKKDKDQRKQVAQELIGDVRDVGGVRLVARVHDGPADELRSLAQDVASQLEGPGGAAVVLGSAQDGKALLVAAASKSLVERGVSAPELLDPAAKLVGGGAGGKPGLAFSGGPKGDRIAPALETIESRLKELLGGR